MKITRKNYPDVFRALLKRFEIIGFCVQCNNYGKNYIVGIIAKDIGKIFVVSDSSNPNMFMSSCLNAAINQCPFEFKHNVILSLKDIEWYCHVEDFDDLLLKFTQEAVEKLCKNRVIFNEKTYEKISIEELLVEADLKYAIAY